MLGWSAAQVFPGSIANHQLIKNVNFMRKSNDFGTGSTGLPETLQQQSIITQIGQKKKKTLQSD
jgi:hypothetical protein